MSDASMKNVKTGAKNHLSFENYAKIYNEIV